MKRFIVTDDRKIVRKVLRGLELADRKDDKLTLIKLKFSMKAIKTWLEMKSSTFPVQHKNFFT